VGGANEPILVLARDNSSGTFLYFQEHVMGKADYRKSLLVLPSNSGITKAVAEDVTSIGYAGLAYAVHASVKLLSIKAATDSTAYLPSLDTVDNGHYPLSRPLMLITNGAAAGEAQQFIAFCLSEAGQKIVTETGYVTVPRQP
jgi:phosphate transport system substrate-binding protein